ncbi:hypothetical protein Zmor_023930 [Zophobas morio]|uniref:Uncharacterized protein n=1 Tax=Zophobas morio TaxID=2755281 RepID=A0AA38HZE0_9CUCU|nr:hypothetical protein Zmor_023930 [Zophobas morio]
MFMTPKLKRHPSRYKSVAMNYINFILEHSKITHRWRCNTSGVWGSWLWPPRRWFYSIGKHMPEIPAIETSRSITSFRLDFYSRSASFVQMAR